jgi:hypothetical protein
MLGHSYFIPKRNRRKQTCFALKIYTEKYMKFQSILYTELKRGVSNFVLLVLCCTKRQNEEENKEKRNLMLSRAFPTNICFQETLLFVFIFS